MSFIIGHEWDGQRKFWQMLEWSHTSFLTADTRGTDCRCLQYRGDRITERQFFSSWFTSFSCILTTPCVGYHACKSIESVVFCLNNIPQIFPPPVYSVFTHVTSIYANLLEQKKVFALEKSSTPTGLVWDTNMAAVSLFWETNMAAVTSCENTLLRRYKAPLVMKLD